MKTGNFFQRLSQNSRIVLILLVAVVAIWIVVLAMIVFGVATYLQRPSVAQQPLPSTTVPVVSVEPTAAQAGTLLTVSGKGWTPDGSISLYLLAPGQSQPPGFATAAATTNAQGEFAASVAVPSGSDWQTAGTATVIANLTGPFASTGDGNGPSAQTTFALLSPQQAPTETPAPTPTETLVPIPTLSPSSTLTPTAALTMPMATSTITANIRSGPGTNYPIEGVLLVGQNAEIVGVSADGAWWEVSSAGLPNGLGWIAESVVTAQDTQNVPVVEAPPVPTPATPVPAAQPPAAVISGPSQAGQNQSITFSGSSSTASAGHTITTYAWNFGDGTTGSGVSVSHSYASSGNFVVSLTVTDDLGQTSTATLTIQITEQGPTANFDNPKHGNVGDVINFDGSESTAASGHSITDYDWSFDDGSDAGGSEVDHIFTRTGDFDVKLKVTDDQGLTSEVRHHIEISGPLVASISAPSQGQVGQSIAFSASSSGSEIVSFVWSFGDGSTASGQNVSHVYAAPGNFIVTLTVADEWDNTATATFSISITGQALQPPTAVINAPNQAIKGQTVTFDGSASTAGSGSITSYAWKFGDGATASGVSVSHAFAKTGNHSVVLIVTNSNNLTAKATHIIQIVGAPQPPKAAISGPAKGTEGQPVSFDGSGSTAGSGTITGYAWDFGDGNTGSGAKVSHTYATAGTFNVSLTVTNSNNLTAKATHSIQIAQPPKPPTAAISGPSTGKVNKSLSFSGSGSSAGSGKITKYAWSFGDGHSGSGENVSHAYAKAGTYTVTLTVTNSDNLTATTTHVVTIS